MKVIESARLVHLNEREQALSQLDPILCLNHETFNKWLQVESELEYKRESFYEIGSPGLMMHGAFFEEMATLEHKQQILRTAASHMGFVLVEACEAATLEASKQS